MEDDPITFLIKAVLTWWLSSTDNFVIGLIFVALMWLIWYAYRDHKRAQKEAKAREKSGKHTSRLGSVSEDELIEALKIVRERRHKKRGFLR